MPYYEDKNPVDVMPPDDAWKPTYWTGMKSERSLGYDMIKWIEAFIIPPRPPQDEDDDAYDEDKWDAHGYRINIDEDEPFRLRDWQRWTLIHMFELDEKGYLRYIEFYLQIPRKNGKSFLGSAIMLYFLFKAEGGEQLLVAGLTRDIARVIYDESLAQVNINPILKKVIKATKMEMENRFVVPRATLKPLTGDARTAHGKAPGPVTWVDETHTLDSLTGTSSRGPDLYGALKSGSKDRREKILINGTTAGNQLKGLAHKLYDYGKLVAMGQVKDDKFGFMCWEAEETDDIYDPKTWYKCNPMLTEGILRLEDFENDLVQAEATSTADFERYNLNKWLQGGDKADFINPNHWKNAAKPELGKIAKGSDVTIGFDGSITEDSTGIVAICADSNSPQFGLIEVLYSWEKPQKSGEEWYVDVEEVMDAMANVFAEYNVLKLYADPSRHTAQVDAWRRMYGGGVVRDIPPTSSRNPPMSQAFRGELYAGRLFHANDPKLTRHVLNAIETFKGVPNKRTRNSPDKIDFLACAILAFGALEEIQRRGKRRAGGIRGF